MKQGDGKTVRGFGSLELATGNGTPAVQSAAAQLFLWPINFKHQTLNWNFAEGVPDLPGFSDIYPHLKKLFFKFSGGAIARAEALPASRSQLGIRNRIWRCVSHQSRTSAIARSEGLRAEELRETPPFYANSSPNNPP